MSLVPEAIPIPGVYHSNNGLVELGGNQLLRVSDAFLRISQGSAIYPEVGSKYAIPYRTLITVTGSIRRSFCNFYEFLIACGFPANSNEIIGFIPGATHDDVLKTNPSLSNLLTQAGVWLEGTGGKKMGKFGTALPDGRPENHYPIKTTIRFLINKDKVISAPGNVNNEDLLKASDRYTHEIVAYGVLIDATQLSVGTGGEIVSSGPFSWVGETYEFNLLTD